MSIRAYAEYVPGMTKPFLLIELHAKKEELCHLVKAEFVSYGCNVDWHQACKGYDMQITGTYESDNDFLFAEIGELLNNYPEMELIEARLASDDVRTPILSKFSFVTHGDGSPWQIILQAGHSFGTGLHPTTQLIMAYMEKMSKPFPLRVLDVGCGSGILSLVAARLGAERVVGLDVCPDSIISARLNVKKNNLLKNIIITDLPLADIDGKFDLVLANLTVSVMCRLVPLFKKYSKPGSFLLLSGLLGKQGGEIAQLCAVDGWRVLDQKSQDGWQIMLLSQ